jgi:hypothetical protein
MLARIFAPQTPSLRYLSAMKQRPDSDQDQYVED